MLLGEDKGAVALPPGRLLGWESLGTEPAPPFRHPAPQVTKEPVPTRVAYLGEWRNSGIRSEGLKDEKQVGLL